MRILNLIRLLAALALPLAAQTPVEWPSYNRTLTSERFVPLNTVNTKTASRLKVVCSYDTGQMTAFQSGLVEIRGALYATTEHDTFSLNPDNCKENWRAHEDFKGSYLGAQRGVAYEDGRIFRGAANGHVYAYDAGSGKRIWDRVIANAVAGESIPACPIVWQGYVFIGMAGGDNRGVKGRMYALEAATGKVVWEFYLVPKTGTDPTYGPSAPIGQLSASATWSTTQGKINDAITGGGTWTSYSLDPTTGLLYVPAGNPSPDFMLGMRPGNNLYAGSLVVLDARTGTYQRHFQLVPRDFHDWDVSSPPALFTTRSGKRLLAITPKDGNLYGFERTEGKRLYRLPMTTMSNTQTPLTTAGVRFCPGTQGGAEWNGPAYDSANDAVLSGQVDWCSTVHIDPTSKVASVAAAQPWTGSSADGFGKQDDPSEWAGWLTSVDAASGAQRWRFKAPFPVMSGVTPTSGGVVVFGDMGGNIYALDSDTGAKLWSNTLDGAIAGGVITYDSGAGQKIAVSTGMTSKIWPTSKVTARVYILGLQ